MIWLLVPIAALGSVVGLLVPVRALAPMALPVQMSDVHLPWPPSSTALAPVERTNWIAVCWMIGAGLFALIQWWQQYAFVRRLGALRRTPGGIWMAEANDVGPMVVGVFPPRIVLPADFHRRYTTREQALVLAHEFMHVTRRDPFVNLATAAVRSLLWFHPLVHLAISYFRRDQEFACDAAVLQIRPRQRYQYACALLKGQVGGTALPAGCPFDSHAAMFLKRRIAMLPTSSPSRGRHALGTIVVAISVIAGGSVVTFFTAPAHAQSVTPARLVGTWERATKGIVMDNGAFFVVEGDTSGIQPVTEYDTLFIRADSTFYFAGKDYKTTPRRWNHLRGDTISFYNNVEFAEYNQKGEPGHKVTLKGPQLTLTPLGDSNSWEGGTYKRVDTPKPTP